MSGPSFAVGLMLAGLLVMCFGLMVALWSHDPADPHAGAWGGPIFIVGAAAFLFGSGSLIRLWTGWF